MSRNFSRTKFYQNFSLIEESSCGKIIVHFEINWKFWFIKKIHRAQLVDIVKSMNRVTGIERNNDRRIGFRKGFADSN